MIKPKAGDTLLLFAAVLASTPAWGQEQEGVIRTESGIDLIPAFIADLQYDDNILRDSNSTLSSWVNTLAPTLKAILVDGPNSYTLNTAVKNAKYFSSSADNYLDAYIDGEAKLALASRHKLDLKMNGSWLHEDRGTGVSEGRGNLLDEVTKFNEHNIKADYEFGSTGSTGKLRANARYYNKDYDNFRSITQYRDHDIRELGAGFVYKTEGAFMLVAEASSADVQFKTTDLTGDRNNQDTNYRLGAEWEMTALTTGILKLGYQDKDFDLSNRENFNGFAWEAILQWLPLSYSGFDLSTGRRAKDVDALNINADYIVETTYALGWNHQWSERFDSKLAYEHQTDEYNKVVLLLNTLGRKDVRRVVTAELNYKALRWLTLTGFVNLEDRTSTLGVIAFDRSVYGLSVKITL